MAKKNTAINLIKDQQNDLIERIINWSLSVGRILVIITEIVALGAFLWRFGLDQQLIDLHTEIKQKQNIITAFKKNEDTYRDLQDRLGLIANFSSIEEKRNKTYRDILNLVTPNILINKFNQSTNSISMEINASSVTALSNFIDTLKAYPEVDTLSINKIETKTTSSTIVVSISLGLKPIQNKYAN